MANPLHHEHGGTGQNPPLPPPPPLPPTSSALSHASGNQAHSHDQSVPLQHLSRPGPSIASGQQAGSQKAGVKGKQPDVVDLLEAVDAVANCLNNTKVKYAIVGGAGLGALGSLRFTTDVDFVVYPPAELKAAKNELRRMDPRFFVDPRTRHATFTSSSGATVGIEGLSSPGTFKG